MKTEWMGRYRALVQALVYSTNLSVMKSGNKKHDPKKALTSSQEWQVLEYIIEHEEDDACMAYISKMLCIPKSTLSKCTKHLCLIGFVARYRAMDNKKSIILKATEGGKAHYRQVVETKMKPIFEPFFKLMDDIPQDALTSFIQALECLNAGRSVPFEERRLVLLDEPPKPADNETSP